MIRGDQALCSVMDPTVTHQHLRAARAGVRPDVHRHHVFGNDPGLLMRRSAPPVRLLSRIRNAPRYLVALVVAPGPGFRDFHWFRKQSGGFWGHKPCGTEARNVDNSGLLITKSGDRLPRPIHR